MPGHATRRQIIAGVLVPRGVRAGTDAGRTRAAEGHGRRLSDAKRKTQPCPRHGPCLRAELSQRTDIEHQATSFSPFPSWRMSG